MIGSPYVDDVHAVDLAELERPRALLGVLEMRTHARFADHFESTEPTIDAPDRLHRGMLLHDGVFQTPEDVPASGPDLMNRCRDAGGFGLELE